MEGKGTQASMMESQYKTAVAPLIDEEGLKTEWPRLKAMIDGQYAKLSVAQLAERILLHHRSLLPNLVKLVEIGICMEVASVECERAFSLQNRLKSTVTASLKTENLDTLMRVRLLGPSLNVFNPSEAVSRWLRA